MNFNLVGESFLEIKNCAVDKRNGGGGVKALPDTCPVVFSVIAFRVLMR